MCVEDANLETGKGGGRGERGGRRGDGSALTGVSTKCSVQLG